MTFKQEVEKKMDLLMHDHDEWSLYQEEMQARIRSRYLQHAAEDESRSVFITQDDEYIDYDLDMLQQRRDTQRLYERQKKCESEGNFISLNRLQIKSGRHDQIAKLKK